MARTVGGRERKTPQLPLSTVVALGERLNKLVHPRDQIRACCEAIGDICGGVSRILVFFLGRTEKRPDRVFQYERSSRALTEVEWPSLGRSDRLKVGEAAADALGLAAPGKEKGGAGRAGRRAPRLLLEGNEGTTGCVLLVGEPRRTIVMAEEEEKAVSLCADMLSSSLDRTRLFEKVLHAKKEWERTADAILDVVMIIRPDWRVRRGNRRLAELGDVPLEAMQGHKCHALLASEEEVCPVCPAARTFETSAEATAEVLRPRDEAVFQVWSYPILDGSGNLDSVAVYEKDITAYKRMQQQLVHAEKMAVVGQLASAVAHELNNPLSGVISFSQILLKEMDPASPHLEDLRTIEHAALRCKKIVEDLLAFARKPVVMRSSEPVDLREVVEQSLVLLGPHLRSKGTRVETRIPRGLPRLTIHPDPLYQILGNLVTNAHDAMEAGGTVRLTAGRQKQDGHGHIVLSVQDTGCGIPAGSLERVFEPFYTTKGPGEGTGLGLPICRKLMESMGGRIEVVSDEGSGTTFTLWFPLAAGAGRTGRGRKTKGRSK